MISKNGSSFSSFCSTSACWRLVYGAMQCNGNVPSQGNGATKADATNRCRFTKNKNNNNKTASGATKVVATSRY